MSSASANNLSREKIQQLLAAIGSKKTEDAGQIEAAEYNWRQPHYFSKDQLNKLKDFMGKAATIYTEKLTASYNGSFDVPIVSTEMHFAYEFLNTDSSQNNYHLAFGTDHNQPWGLITIPSPTATIWTTQLLGDSETNKDPARDLSRLEELLLLDITSLLVAALSDSYGNYILQPALHITRGQLPLKLQGTEEFCKITFNIRKTGTENNSEAYLLIPCSKLQNVAGKTAQAETRLSADNAQKAILAHLDNIKLSVTAQLAPTMLTFEEIMSLQADDIMLLDKKTDEAVDLFVVGQQLFRGRLAKSAGNYAVVITESPFQ